MRGHLWTVVPHLRDGLSPPTAPGVPWSTQLSDSIVGTLRLTGILDEVVGSKRLVVLVHGMGGHADKGYVVRAARFARAMGLSSLRLNLRGCDEAGGDIYHAGLVADLEAALASPELEPYDHLHALGFSLGGHMVARHALQPAPRVRSVAAICSPLDLAAACKHIDGPKQLFYRRHLLAGLKRNVEKTMVANSHLWSDGAHRTIRRIRDWDSRIVAPRFGFADAEDYYQQVSVAPHLDGLVVPSLFVFATGDPMVGDSSTRAASMTKNPRVAVRRVPGGHVHTPARVGAIQGSLRWLCKHS